MNKIAIAVIMMLPASLFAQQTATLNLDLVDSYSFSAIKSADLEVSRVDSGKAFSASVERPTVKPPVVQGPRPTNPGHVTPSNGGHNPPSGGHNPPSTGHNPPSGHHNPPPVVVVNPPHYPYPGYNPYPNNPYGPGYPGYYGPGYYGPSHGHTTPVVTEPMTGKQIAIAAGIIVAVVLLLILI